MNRRNIYYLAASNLALRVVGQGLLPLYPVLLLQNPISKTWMGYFMAGLYAAIFLGNWFSAQLLKLAWPLKKIVAITYIPIVIGLVGMGLQNNYLSLFYFVVLMSFFNGINLNISSIILGANSDQESIMKNFAWVGLSSILATLLGGLIVGPSINTFGNKIAFLGFAFLVGCSSIFTLLLKEDTVKKKQEQNIPFTFHKNFVLLLAAMFLLTMLIHFFKISLSFKMKELGYNISQISLFSTFGTIAVVPLPFLLSYLSRKVQAKNLLFSTQIATILAFGLLYFFSRNISFVAAITCISYMSYTARIPLMKLLHSIIDNQHFAKAQTIYGSLTWLSAILGYLSAGYLLDNTSFNFVFFVGASFALISTLILRLGVKIKV